MEKVSAERRIHDILTWALFPSHSRGQAVNVDGLASRPRCRSEIESTTTKPSAKFSRQVVRAHVSGLGQTEGQRRRRRRRRWRWRIQVEFCSVFLFIERTSFAVVMWLAQSVSCCQNKYVYFVIQGLHSFSSSDLLNLTFSRQVATWLTEEVIWRHKK